MWGVLEVVHVLKVVVVEQGRRGVDGWSVVVLTSLLLYEIGEGLRRLIPRVKPCQRIHSNDMFNRATTAI